LYFDDIGQFQTADENDQYESTYDQDSHNNIPRKSVAAKYSTKIDLNVRYFKKIL
jgi:hypothetical protein